VTANESELPISSLGTVLGGFNQAERSCKVAAGLNFVITYAEMDFSANPQKYIIKIEKKVQAVDWKFNRRKPTETQVFPVEASFQFVRVDQQEVRDQLFKEA